MASAWGTHSCVSCRCLWCLSSVTSPWSKHVAWLIPVHSVVVAAVSQGRTSWPPPPPSTLASVWRPRGLCTAVLPPGTPGYLDSGLQPLSLSAVSCFPWCTALCAVCHFLIMLLGMGRVRCVLGPNPAHGGFHRVTDADGTTPQLLCGSTRLRLWGHSVCISRAVLSSVDTQTLPSLIPLG